MQPLFSATFPSGTPKRDKPVGKPADGYGTPHHLNAEPGRHGNCEYYPDAQIHQIGDGEHFHVACTTQQPVHRHFETDQTEEPAHECEIASPVAYAAAVPSVPRNNVTSGFASSSTQMQIKTALASTILLAAW